MGFPCDSAGKESACNAGDLGSIPGLGRAPVEEKGMTEDEMVGWHHRLNGHEFESTPGVGDRQGGLVGCSLWDCRESDTTERLN